ncbi:MAG: 4-hydroxyphenylacetate 3-hydroxylase N-terminal domain-containing protein, partial [Candidatus Entotheonellia bacterium]
MTFDTTTAVGAMTGARYLESLKDGREVWLDGEKVQDVTTHPAFTGMVHELARIYDLQHTEAYRDQMTFISPATGHRCSVSWLLPRSLEDLKKKRRNSELWNEQCWGQLGRGPDILAPYIITLYDIRETLSAVRHPRCDFGENVVNYYHYCLEHDLFLTHALGDPQVDRSQQPQNEQRTTQEEELVLH